MGGRSHVGVVRGEEAAPVYNEVRCAHTWSSGHAPLGPARQLGWSSPSPHTGDRTRDTRGRASGSVGLCARGAWRLVIGTIIARPVSGSRTVRADDAPGARRARGGRVVWVPRVVPDEARSRRPAHQLELPATHRHLLNLINTDIMLCSVVLVPCTAVWIRPLPARLSASGSVTRRWECCIRTRARQPCYCHWQCHSQLPMAAAQGRPGCDRSRQPRRP